MFKKYLLMTTAAFAPPREGETSLEGDEDVADQDQEIEGSAEADEDVGEDAGDGEGADEAEGDAEGEDEGALAAAPRKPNRAQARIQTLTQSAREAKERADRLERDVAELRAAQRQPVQQGESAETRAARRALMDPMEIMREDLRESEARTQQILHQNMMESREANDLVAYHGEIAASPHLKKYEAEVEKIRLEAKASGQFVPRKVLLELAVGRAAIAAAKKAGSKPGQQAQRRVAAQQTRPTPARGDTATQRGRQGDSLEKRLENIPI